MSKKFELTADDQRAGVNHQLKKIGEHLAKQESAAAVDLSEVKEIDVDGKVTNKEIAEAFNTLVKALKA